MAVEVNGTRPGPPTAMEPSGLTTSSTTSSCGSNRVRPTGSSGITARRCRNRPGHWPPYTGATVRTLYRARRVRTLSYPAEGEWVLVDERHVERVGSGDPPAADRLVEIPGATITPGFIDAHVHLTGTGLSGVGIPIERARSAGELLGLVAEELTHGPTRVLAHGFDETQWDK